MSSYRSILVNPRAYAWGYIGVFALALQGQVNTATLLGTVKDPTSAAVPNATVVVKSLETGQERTIVTDSTGNYTFANLQVGHYRLTVWAPGFKTTAISDIELQVAQMATANVSLEIGQASQNGTVSAELPLMNTVSSAVSQVVDTKADQSLPLNGPSFSQPTPPTPAASYTPAGQ